MIISFTVRNYKSLKDETTLHFSAVANDKIHPENIAYPDKNEKIPVVRSVGIWGANASGKSNVLDALQALCSLVNRSHRNDLDGKIREYRPCMLKSECKKSPIFFELDFIDKNKEHYIYTVEFLEDRIIKESLEFYDSPKPTTLFLRELTVDGKTPIKFSSKLTGAKAISYLDNQAYLSVAGNTSDSSELIKNAYRYIRDGINFISHDELSIEYLTDDIYRKKLAALLHCSDTGITNVNYQKRELSEDVLKHFPKEMPEKIRERILSDLQAEPIFLHQNSDAEFHREDESAGTRRLYSIAPYILKGISLPEVFVFDELERELHPKLAEMIIRLFHDEKVNGNNPQLLFTTHNTSLMNSDLFRRDQICLTQKRENGATELSSLADYDKVRPDTNFEKWYREGRFDAIPELNYEMLRDTICASFYADKIEDNHDE
ncbi:MAG: ATP-binding protein [Victivallales bacterium]|jgi:AAA15 family ATPase/GTPase|nr:ATP-binding protein [Victivallales bacterium]